MKMRFFWLVIVLFALSGCGDKAEIERLTRLKETLETENRSLKSSLTKFQPQFKRVEELDNRLNFLKKQLDGLTARLVTNLGTVEVRFFPQDAPLHCMAFIARAESGFYNGTQFHRVIPGFMIQGGDPNSKDKNPLDDGGGGPVFNTPHEFNKRSHKRGVLSTARVGNKTVGAGCQFFIMHGDAVHLDNEYTVFGAVTKGMDVVDKIATTTTYKTQFEQKTQGKRPEEIAKMRRPDPRLNDHPVRPVVIQSVEILGKGEGD